MTRYILIQINGDSFVAYGCNIQEALRNVNAPSDTSIMAVVCDYTDRPKIAMMRKGSWAERSHKGRQL